MEIRMNTAVIIPWKLHYDLFSSNKSASQLDVVAE